MVNLKSGMYVWLIVIVAAATAVFAAGITAMKMESKAPAVCVGHTYLDSGSCVTFF